MRASAIFLFSTLVVTSASALSTGCKLPYEFGSNGSGASAGAGGAELVSVCGDDICDPEYEDTDNCPLDCHSGSGGASPSEGGASMGGAGGAETSGGGGASVSEGGASMGGAGGAETSSGGGAIPGEGGATMGEGGAIPGEGGASMMKRAKRTR